MATHNGTCAHCSNGFRSSQHEKHGEKHPFETAETLQESQRILVCKSPHNCTTF